jgi:hypothetical protein
MKEMGVKRDNIKQGTPGAAGANEPEYPHIMLSEKHIAKIGLKDLPSVGSKMHMAARVHVEGAMMHDGPSGKERSLHLKITHMDLGKGGEHEETESDAKSDKLYGESKEK